MSLFPPLGLGLSLRREHYSELLAERPRPVEWLEVISENYMPVRVGWGDPALKMLDRLRETYPLALHGVSLSLGSADPLNPLHLKALKALQERYAPAWISDHLCWTSVDGHYLHDLLPLPYTIGVARHLAEKIKRVQDTLGQRILIENVSSYFSYTESNMPEWAFLTLVTELSDCGILLDINNIYVSAVNHGFDPLDYLNALPASRIGQIHLAGHSQRGDLLFDTHDGPVSQPVWNLYKECLLRFGQLATSLEWDEHIPPLANLLTELELARQLRQAVQFVSPKVKTASVDLTRDHADNSLDLLTIQQGLKSVIQEPRGVSKALSQKLFQPTWIHFKDTADLEARLALYAEGYFWRLCRNLERLFPATADYLGHVPFRRVTASYYAAHPPRDAQIQETGADFPEFLIDSGACLEAIELARLERLCYEISHSDTESEPAPPLGSQNTYLLWLPGLRLFESVCPLQTLLKHAHCYEIRPEPTHHSPAVTACRLLLWRSPMGICRLELSASAWLLAKLTRAFSLEEACQQLEQQIPELSPKIVTEQISLWVRLGLVKAHK